jgi:dethiobiotin synthetase
MRKKPRKRGSRVLFITGTDTGVGKTVVTALLARYLLLRGFRVVALKPISSGSREDARRLGSAMSGALGLETINPWHFRAPLAPRLAAQSESSKVRMADVLRHIRYCGRRVDTVLVEGAGGLLTPLGEDFDSRDLIVRLRALPIVVCPNRLGAISQVRLVLGCLPPARAREVLVVLVSAAGGDASTSSNRRMLSEFIAADRIVPLPWHPAWRSAAALRQSGVRRAMARLTAIANGKQDTVHRLKRSGRRGL